MAETAFVTSVPASKAGLAAALEATSAHLRPRGIGAALEARVALLIEEAVMNVVMHGGHESAPARPLTVELSVRLSPAAIELRLRDDGRPFDPRQAPPPQGAASVESAVPGGNGVPLMRRFASTMQYRRADDRNELTLTVAR